MVGTPGRQRHRTFGQVLTEYRATQFQDELPNLPHENVGKRQGYQIYRDGRNILLCDGVPR